MKSWIIGLLIYFSGVAIAYPLLKGSRIQEIAYRHKEYPSLSADEPTYYTQRDRHMCIVFAGFSWVGVLIGGVSYLEYDSNTQPANW